MKHRVLFYLYGMPHIVGSLAALVGLGLYFGGFIDRFWYLIVIGLYAAGALGWPRSPEHSLRLRAEANLEEIQASLNRLVKSLRGEVTEPVAHRVRDIVALIQAVLPRLMHLEKADRAAYAIRETALTYLPETLENYLRLPKAYRRFHKLRDGRTPEALLEEQLAILEQQMTEVVEDVHRDDLNSLQAHGRFLQSRFACSDNFIN